MSDGGRLEIRLQRHGATVAAEIVQGRPTLPRKFLIGRHPDELVALLPKLFAVCSVAQGSAAAFACESASGVTVDRRRATRRRIAVALETAREHLFRLILGVADALGEAPAPRNLAGLRALAQGIRAIPGSDDGWMLNTRRMLETVQALVEANFFRDDTDADPEVEADRFLHWVDARGSPFARFVAGLVDSAVDGGGLPVTVLPELDPTAVAARMLGACGAEFAATPTWMDSPRETTPFARQRHAPLLVGLDRRFGDGIGTRLVARQVELCRLIPRLFEDITLLDKDAGPVDASAMAQEGRQEDLGEGIGVAQVETARGRLIHAARIRDGRIADYRILAPTEWNFHPRGPVVARLSRLSGSEIEKQARLWIDAFDPCVPYLVTVQ